MATAPEPGTSLLPSIIASARHFCAPCLKGRVVCPKSPQLHEPSRMIGLLYVLVSACASSTENLVMTQ